MWIFNPHPPSEILPLYCAVLGWPRRDNQASVCTGRQSLPLHWLQPQVVLLRARVQRCLALFLMVADMNSRVAIHVSCHSTVSLRYICIIDCHPGYPDSCLRWSRSCVCGLLFYLFVPFLFSFVFFFRSGCSCCCFIVVSCYISAMCSFLRPVIRVQDL